MSIRGELLKRADFALLFSRTPLSVTLDPKLQHADRTTFDVISFLGMPGNSCKESIRDLAAVLSTDKTQVRRSIARLISSGHVRRSGDSLEIASPIFQQRGLVAGSIREHGRAKVTCGNCGKPRHSLLKVGWCRSCNFNFKIRKVVRDEIATTRPVNVIQKPQDTESVAIKEILAS